MKYGETLSRVLSDNQRRNLVAENVSQQLKQCEDEQEHQESSHDHGQVHAKVAQHIIVQDHGEARAEYAAPAGRALKRVFGAAEWQPGSLLHSRAQRMQ